MTEIQKNQSSGTVRVRFAPSPTGDLHVGGVRTALFNYLFARHTGGKFLLRIEDTDRERSTDEATRVILDGLSWLGLEPDEEIVYQGSRIEQHRKAALKLVETGAAYRAFETAEELAKQREGVPREERLFKYDRASLKLSVEEIDKRLARGDPHVIRLKVPAGEVSFNDAVHGTIKVSTEEIEDFILLRSDGTPTYNLAVVVDDADMAVTHVIRGDDHISNTPKQILLYRALGLPEPEFAHVPLILGSDKKRLSKRHGATSVTEYKDSGYLPDTLINYLGLLGWSPGDDRNIISRQELIDLYSLSGIQSSGAVFDEDKLNWLNGHYIAKTDYSDITGELDRLAQSAVVQGRLDAVPSPEKIEAAWNVLKNRIHLTRDLFDGCIYMFNDPSEYEWKGIKKHFSKEGVADRLEVLTDDFETASPFNVESTEEIIRRRADEWEISAGKLIHPVRLAVSGVTYGPGIFDLLEALGQQTVIRRILTAVVAIRSGKIFN